MRRTPTLFNSTSLSRLIRIENGTFYREHPATASTSTSSSSSTSTSNPPLFPQLNFSLSATTVDQVGSRSRLDEHWAVIAASDASTFLEVLRGSHICLPPNARTYPYLASNDIDKKDHRLRVPSRAIQYVGFNAGKGQSFQGGLRGAYLSARYESRREDTDWSLLQYLKGDTELNPAESQDALHPDEDHLHQVVHDLKLKRMLSMPVSQLSNGQTRRARIAKALLGKPELLLLDEPFMGLDPPTLVSLSPMLRELAYRSAPLLLLALRPQDPIPDWITHLAILGQHNTLALAGEKARVLFRLHRWLDLATTQDRSLRRGFPKELSDLMQQNHGTPPQVVGDSLGEDGITRYTTYADVKRNEDHYFGSGVLRKTALTPQDLKRFEKAIHRAAHKKSQEDLLVLTASLPADFQTQQSEANPEQSVLHPAEPPTTATSEAVSTGSPFQRRLGDPLIELESVVVKYGDKTVLGHPPPQPGYHEPGLNLTIRQGTRLALLGPNGSGKTTFLALLTSDHPQSYSLPIKFFGRSRLPTQGQPGLSLWDIQSRIGHSSPEIHAFFPKRLTIRQALESAWSETYSARPTLSYQRDEMVNAILRWFEPELHRQTPYPPHIQVQGRKPKDNAGPNAPDVNVMVKQSYPPFAKPNTDEGKVALPSENLDWADDPEYTFGVLPFATQRLLLFLRAIIKQPDIIILDEAFSGLSAQTRDKAISFLEYGQSRIPLSVFQPTDRLIDSDLPSTSNTGASVPTVPNHRVAVQRAAHRLSLDFPVLLRNMNYNEGYGSVRDMSVGELLNAADQAVPDPTDNSELFGYTFPGLTPQQALVVVSHVKEEIPGCVDEYVRLPGEDEVLDQNRTAELGRCENAVIRTSEGWNRVWGFGEKFRS